MSITAHTPAHTANIPTAVAAPRIEVEDTDWAEFSTTEAVEWIAAGFLPAEAIEWDEAGWSADEAAVLRAAGFSTFEAEPWLGSDSNIDNVLRCLRSGIAAYDSDLYDSMGRRGNRYADEDEWN